MSKLSESLFGNYDRHTQKQNNLALRAAHRALDIPEDMNVTTHSTGIGPLGLIGTALAAGIPSVLLAAAVLWMANRPAPGTVPPTSIPLPAKPYLFDEIEQILQPDGSWKNTGKTTRRKMNPDGSITTVTP